MNRLADSIILMWGWRRLALAFVVGAAMVLTLAPFYAVPVGWISIPVLIWLIDGSATPEGTGFVRRLLPAAAVGWWFGFGYFLAGLWWIGPSFLVEADVFGWMMPFAILLLCGGLALIWSIGTALARLLWTDGWRRILVFAVVMTATEWVRGHALSGFPWNTIGYAIMPDPLLMQPASIVGLYGMTLLALLVFAAPTLLAGSGEYGRGRWLTLAAIIVLALADVGFGLLRLRGAEDATVEGVRLRIVQANLPQAVKQDRDRFAANFERHIALSLTSPAPGQPGGPTHIIWPETAVPYLLTQQPGALAAIADMLPEGTTLITGAPRRGASGETMNSVLVIDDTGEIADSYDKVHLVPFGEYLPFADFLEGLGIRQLIALPGGFAAGLERRALDAEGVPSFAPLICYEIVFPHQVVPGGDERPGWLLNVTNDAWFGDTIGPRQHFQQSVVRAVEEGLPLVRASNTGIPAIVDPYGQTVARLAVGESGVVDGELSQALPATIYARLGDLTVAGLCFLLLVIVVTRRSGHSRQYN